MHILAVLLLRDVGRDRGLRHGADWLNCHPPELDPGPRLNGIEHSLCNLLAAQSASVAWILDAAKQANSRT